MRKKKNYNLLTMNYKTLCGFLLSSPATFPSSTAATSPAFLQTHKGHPCLTALYSLLSLPGTLSPLISTQLFFRITLTEISPQRFSCSLPF